MSDANLATDPLLASVPVHEGYKVLGGVVLYQKLGQGGMGAVYRGRHVRLEIDMALKVMVPPAGISQQRADAFVKRFLREARTAARIQHPNLIRVTDANTESGVYYLVMDFVEGESAADRLERKGPLPEAEAVEICLGAAEGLAEAHRRGIVHRDVKPDNIMIDMEGRVKVADLGLAKAFAGDDDDDHSMLTQTQQAMGTPSYMAPEQFKSARSVGPPADAWSLGVTLYQLLTGKVPWEDSSIFGLARKIQDEPLPDARELKPELSGGVCEIIDKALRKDLAERYAECEPMSAALREHLASIAQAKTVLPDPEAGSISSSSIRVSPPPEESLSVIAAQLNAAAVPEQAEASENEASRRAAPPVSPRPTPARVGALPWVFAAILLLAGATAAWYFLAGRGAKQPMAGVTPDSGGHAGATVDPQKERRVEELLRQAKTFRDLNALDKARDALAQAVAIVPDHAEAKRRLAELIRRMQKNLSARERARDHKKWLDKGLELRLSGSLAQAAQAYEKAATYAPQGSTEARDAAAACRHDECKARAEASEKNGDLQKAVDLYTQALGHRDTAPTRQALVQAEASLAKQLATEKRSAQMRKWLALARQAEREGKPDTAIGYYREAAKHGADVAAQVASLEREIARREEQTRRQAAYERAMTRARSLTRGRRWKEAVSAYGEALRQKPGDPQATGLLAEAKKRLGPAKTLTLDLGRGVTMQLVLIPAGEFLMGSPAGEESRQPDETQHRVRITKPFYMGKYEVTQAQWQAVMGTNPSGYRGDSLPVENISWNDCQEFLKKLSRKTGRTVRLPTEAQWEYACRAGTTTPFHFGETISTDQANYNGTSVYGSGRKGVYRQKTTPVGTFRPNSWGLYDMHGNVWEWCRDWYAKDYDGKSAQSDPTGPTDGVRRVLRGSAWVNEPHYCRSARRAYTNLNLRSTYFGIRVVLPVSSSRTPR